MDLVNNKAMENNPDTFIHAIWYCVSAVDCRFEEFEKESLLKLTKLYEGDKLPIIIVLTQSYDSDDVKELTAVIKGFIPQNLEIFPVVQ